MVDVALADAYAAVTMQLGPLLDHMCTHGGWLAGSKK